MSKPHNPKKDGDEVDSIEGSHGSSGTRSPWHREPSPPKLFGDEQYPHRQEAYLAEVGAGARAISSDVDQTRSDVDEAEDMASTAQREKEEGQANLQAEVDASSNDENTTTSGRSRESLPVTGVEASSRISADKLQADRGGLSEQSKHQE